MKLLGDEAEAQTAEVLAKMGFDLVYQSRASRGAFDLLALRGAKQLGIQVKRCELPLGFTKTEWNCMAADAERLGWHWVVATLVDGRVVFLDPAKRRVSRQMGLHQNAAIENLLGWLDDRQ